jgi:hypothetical protein
LWQVGGLLPVLRFAPTTKLTVNIKKKNIVESGVKYHNDACWTTTYIEFETHRQMSPP